MENSTGPLFYTIVQNINHENEIFSVYSLWSTNIIISISGSGQPISYGSPVAMETLWMRNVYVWVCVCMGRAGEMEEKGG